MSAIVTLMSPAGLAQPAHATGSAAASRLTSTAHARNSTAGPVADFNGDGYGDLAVGVPDEGVGTHAKAGGVNVLYGTASCLSSTGNQFWSQDSPGVEGVAEAGDLFGWAVAVGDFNQDGCTDLAVGVPGESIGSAAGVGAVNILYGSATGLTSTGNQVWDQNSPGVLGTAQAEDAFGYSLAVGDLNGDGIADLAIGAPGESNDDGCDGCPYGVVNVLYGSASGLTAAANQILRGDQADAEFGYALAAGDFDASGTTDLAVGEPFASSGGQSAAGRWCGSPARRPGSLVHSRRTTPPPSSATGAGRRSRRTTATTMAMRTWRLVVRTQPRVVRTPPAQSMSTWGPQPGSETASRARTPRIPS
jgi:hypothetical protein